MRITLSITKSVQDNANHYFEKSKKYKRKIEGAKEAIKRLQLQLDDFNEQRDKILQAHQLKQAKKAQPKRTLHWFEKFRWFKSSEGFLCVGGRDAGTNEIIIKKHTDKDDIVFHTEAPGSPFFVVKKEGKEPGEKTLNETAQATVSYSKAWKTGISLADVYWVNPDQVSKEANTGEYIVKGAFMVRGKRNFMKAKLVIAVGVTEEGLVMGGPVAAIEANCKQAVRVYMGDLKPSDVAKKIAKKLGAEIDDVLRVLPAGTMKT
jgi:predicted ribosome quality control (RQC) complex YloA/Tae2 family protein